ncbi:hypothetical protein CVT24_001770 [Panaeolus cyanescens]|uniref:MYND-type domain-containing protein n=1 Tax=Panaeolus cyanescens TaxID=181874 RepID=A0A409YUE8_9AGAR|nr:hypothetical protein CVT24_001770 [Panaeolus cyanescens]
MSVDTKIRLRSDFDVRATEYVTQALKNPLQPKKCAGAIVFALGNLNSHDNLTDEFWSTLYGFLMIKRSDKQLQSLFEHLTKCSCKPDSYGFHATYVATKHVHGPGCLSAHRPYQEAEQLIYHAFQAINQNLDPELLNIKEVTKGISKTWPHKIGNLMPNGADDLVHNIVQWHNILPWTHTSTMTRTVLNVTKICGSVIFDSLIKYDATNILVLDPTRRGCDRLLQVLEANGRLAPYDRQLFDTVMTDFLDYLTEISAQLPISGLIFNGGETKAIQLCSIILYLIPSLTLACTDPIEALSFPMVSGWIAHFAGLLYQTAKLHLPGRPSFPVNPDIVDKNENRPPPREKPPPEHAISLAIMVSRLYYPCSAPSCQLTFSHVANEYKKCAKCAAVAYCSKACQVKDWKDEWYPHKRVCPLVCQIIEARGGWKAPPKEISEDWDGSMDGIKLKHDMIMCELEELLPKMREDGRLSEDDFEFLNGWAQRMYSTKVDGKDNEKGVWHPGYADYDTVIRRFLNIPGLGCPQRE